MKYKMLLMTAFLALGIAPAMAQQTVGSTSATPRLSSSDEDFLSEMPMDDFPGAAELQDLDNDGIVDSEDSEIAIPDPFPSEGGEEETQPQIKYVYKGASDTTLRRAIKDDRIDDGFVQGLMQQRGPQQ